MQQRLSQTLWRNQKDPWRTAMKKVILNKFFKNSNDLNNKYLYPFQGSTKLHHCLVEANKFEYFNPNQEYNKSHHLIVNCLPKTNFSKTYMFVFIFKMNFFHFLIH